MTIPSKHFHYVYRDNKATRTLFLLHGTGGDEFDLLPLVTPLNHHYNLVGLRGNVNEDGLSRFFARTSSGVFDQDSIKVETQKLTEFTQEWSRAHTQETAHMAFVGYSNGANMILATCFNYPHLVQEAALLHPMLPFVPPQELSLAGISFLLTYGTNDQMISAAESQQIIELLRKRQANVRVVTHSGGHQVAPEELASLVQFLTLGTGVKL